MRIFIWLTKNIINSIPAWIKINWLTHFYGSGFENGDGSCCGFANIELGPLCSSFTLKMCNDTSQYVFWDSYHPTEKAYKILVKEILEKKLDEFVW